MKTFSKVLTTAICVILALATVVSVYALWDQKSAVSGSGSNTHESVLLENDAQTAVDTSAQTSAQASVQNITEDPATVQNSAETSVQASAQGVAETAGVITPDKPELAPAAPQISNLNSAIAKNKEVVGWLTLAGADVDYGVAYTDTNSKYINTAIDGVTNSLAGALFLDCYNSGDFTDFNNVIYGHNMASGNMFGNLKKFEEKSFFDKNGKGVLYTTDKTYSLDAVAYVITNAADTRLINPDVIDKADWLNYTKQIATQFCSFNPTINDTYVLLITCGTEYTNARNILIMRATETTGSDIETTTAAPVSTTVPSQVTTTAPSGTTVPSQGTTAPTGTTVPSQETTAPGSTTLPSQETTTSRVPSTVLPGELIIPAKQVVLGNPPEEEEFVYRLVAEDPENPMPEGSSNGIKITTHLGAGDIDFGEISFPKAGMYIYKISAIEGVTSGYTYDDTVYTLSVAVLNTTTGKFKVSTVLQAVGAPAKTDCATFVSSYDKPDGPSVTPANYVINAQKTLDGNTPTSGVYKFILKQGDEVVQEVTNFGRNINFRSLTFSEPGAYIFTLTEEAGSDTSVVYDKTVYTYIATVVRVQDTLMISVKCSKDGVAYTGDAIFANKTAGQGGDSSETTTSQNNNEPTTGTQHTTRPSNENTTVRPNENTTVRPDNNTTSNNNNNNNNTTNNNNNNNNNNNTTGTNPDDTNTPDTGDIQDIIPIAVLFVCFVGIFFTAAVRIKKAKA